MRRKKVKYVMYLIVSLVVTIISPAIPNTVSKAEDVQTDKPQTDKPWVTSLPYVTISEYNESTGTKGKDYYCTQVSFDEEEHSVEFYTTESGPNKYEGNTGIMFNLDPVEGKGVDLSKYEGVKVDIEGYADPFLKIMKDSSSYWSQIDGGIFGQLPLNDERRTVYFDLDYLDASERGDRSNVQAICVSCKAFSQRVKIYGIEFVGEKIQEPDDTPAATANPAYQSSCEIPLGSSKVAAKGFDEGVYMKNSSGIIFSPGSFVNYVNLENFFKENGINFSKYQYAYISYQIVDTEGNIIPYFPYENGKITLAEKGSINGFSDGVMKTKVDGGTISGVAEFDFSQADKKELAKAMGINLNIWGIEVDSSNTCVRISQIYLTQNKGEIKPLTTPVATKKPAATPTKKPNQVKPKVEKKSTKLMQPVFKIKKKKQGKIRYLQITLKKYKGTYLDIYAKKKKKYNRVSKNKLSIKKYKAVFKIRINVKNMKLGIRIRTWQKKGNKKIYSKWSKTKRISV